jgi:peroxiredoxin Q/BCP
MARLEAGDKAPAFSLPDQDGKKVALKDLKGNTAVIYFYPADDTPGCTKEACQFNENLTTFNRAGVKVVGISPDGAIKHQRFREKYGLKFPLLSDPEHTTMEAFGAWGEKTMYGKKTVGTIRSTFLLDDKGVITRAWYNVRADGHAAKVLEEIKATK